MTKGFVVEKQMTTERLRDLLTEIQLYKEIDDNDITEIQRLIKDKSNPYN
jgi:hypothetical protein